MIFICYSTKQKQFAELLHLYLECEGLTVWRDTKNLPPGERYDEEIEAAINNCSVLVYIQSLDSSKSDFVTQELSLAKKRKKKIYTLIYKKLRKHIVPEPTTTNQQIDLTSGDLDRKIKNLVSAIKNHYKKQSSQAKLASKPETKNLGKYILSLARAAHKRGEELTAEQIINALCNEGFITPDDSIEITNWSQ